MQWNICCILLASIALISASDHEIRSKRDLSLIKSYVLSKIFGSYDKEMTPIAAKPANYRLFRVPGFDNILVKAVPKVPVVLEADAPPSVLEVTEAEPVHPSIAIVSKYLGTNKLNDTLFALKGVKDLLQSGVLTAKREGIEKIAAFKGSSSPVVLEASKIIVDEARRPFMVYPSMEKYRPAHVPRYSYLPIPSRYSYKQVNNDGVMSYEAHDNQNVIVTESKRPVPLPNTINYRIQDILSGSYRLPTSPAMDMGIKSYPAPIPVFDVPKVQIPYPKVKEMPSYIPSGFSYNQVHNDGSVTTYSGSGQVEEHEGDAHVVITEAKQPTMSVVVAEMEGNVPKVQGPYYVNHVHSDGSVTSYTGSGHVVEHEAPKPPVVITEPGRPTVVVSDVKGPPAPFPVFNVPKAKVPSGSGYTYNHVHNDGSITTYSGSGHVEHGGKKSAAIVTEFGRPTVVVADVEGTPARFPAFNVPQVKVPSTGPGFSYNHVHKDGVVTTYSGSRHVLEHQGEKSAVVITEPGRPTVVVSDVDGPPAPFPVFSASKAKVPYGSGYSYNHVHNDGSVTSYSGSGHVKEHGGENSAVVISEPGRPTIFVSDVEGPSAPFTVFNPPMVKVPSSSGYSYSSVHNGGFVTAQGLAHEGRKPAVVITEPGRPTVVVADAKGPPGPFPVFNAPNLKVPGDSRYSYNYVHNDGSVTTYSGSGHVVGHEGGKPAVVVTELGRPTVVVSDIQGPPAPFPVFNIPKVKVSSGPGYSYNHIRNDGSVATYSGSENLEEGEVHKSAVLITDPGRPTVMVGNVERPHAPKVKVPSVSGYSYNHVRNDGSMTSYSGAGHVTKHEGERPSVVITEPGRPTVVVADLNGPPAPFPVSNSPMVKVSANSGYSYNHVHNDGSMTTYSGSRSYRPSVPAYYDHAVIVEQRPDYVNHVRNNPYEIPNHPNYKEQVNVHSLNHNNKQSRPTSNVPSGFSYNTVHEDGSITSYTDAGVVSDAHAMHDRPILYPTGSAVTVNTGKEHLLETVICKDPTHSHNEFNRKEHSNKHNANINSSKFSYTTVNEGGSSTTYSGSGHVEHNKVNNAAHIDVNQNSSLLVTQTDADNPEKVLLKPVLSQYMYKQINHHRPDEFTIVNVGDESVIDGQSNEKVSASIVSRKSELQSQEVSKIPKDYVFMPPSTTKEPVPTKKPMERTPSSTKMTVKTEPSSSKIPLAAVPTSTKVSHSFKPKRVYRHRVRTSTSSSSSRVVKTSAPLTTTSKVASSTVVTSSEDSLSANPIVVLPEDNVFSFKQDRSDGTSITVVGNKENKVSVVEEPKISPNRGDIPDSTF